MPDHTQSGPLGSIQLAVRQDVGHTDDSVQRGADLVTHHSEKSGLRSVGRFRRRRFLPGALNQSGNVAQLHGQQENQDGKDERQAANAPCHLRVERVDLLAIGDLHLGIAGVGRNDQLG